jgi:hypothetical protein
MNDERMTEYFRVSRLLRVLQAEGHAMQYLVRSHLAGVWSVMTDDEREFALGKVVGHPVSDH